MPLWTVKKVCTVMLCMGFLAAAPVAAQTETPTPQSIVVTVILVPASATPTPLPSETPLPSITPTPSDTPTVTPTPSATPMRLSVVTVSTDDSGGTAEMRVVYTVSAGDMMVSLLLLALLAMGVTQWVLRRQGIE